MNEVARRQADDRVENATPVRNSALGTTDPQDELFDVLDCDGRPTGLTKRRGDVHRDGDWHGALQIWVGSVGTDGTPYVVFQRRSLTKDTSPGCLDTAIGGHIRSGETLEDTVREAEEEIGLAVTLTDLTFVGHRVSESFLGRIIDREVQSIFAVRSDQPLQAYRLHPDEVDAIVAIALDRALDLFAGRSETVVAHECPRDGKPFTTCVTRDDFAFRDVRYLLAALPALGIVIAGGVPEMFDIRTTTVFPRER